MDLFELDFQIGFALIDRELTIGGTSLFGGRGKAIHGVLGGIVIAGIDNGMGLLGFTAASKYMVTALVLLAAVTIDALSRRGRVAT